VQDEFLDKNYSNSIDNLINYKIILRVEKMIETIKKYPKMCLEALKITESLTLPDYRFNNIIVSGMGGSAIAGDLLKDLLRDEIKIPIEVCREYHIPAYVNENTLVFCISYSGNTEETLSQFVDCIERNCKIIGITSDGKLKEWCEKLQFPCVVIPTGLQPRSSLPYLFFSLLLCLQKFGLINQEKEMNETIEVLENINIKNIKKMALSLKDSIPVIYGSDIFASVAKRIKTQFNENSKNPAKYDVFPELDHNELVGYENNELNKNSVIIFLRDKDEPNRTKTRIEVTRGMIENKVKKIIELWSRGKSKLAKMMSLLFLGDVLSYELAVLNKVDPETTESIVILKNELKKKLNLVEKLEKKLINFSV
jgi:glucose/mannose-6-phosphate isomerase